jgi:hypothetical protein
MHSRLGVHAPGAIGQPPITSSGSAKTDPTRTTCIHTNRGFRDHKCHPEARQTLLAAKILPGLPGDGKQSVWDSDPEEESEEGEFDLTTQWEQQNWQIECIDVFDVQE